MATRGNPAERQREREELRQQIEEPQEEISLGMMVDLPAGELVGIFRGLKALRSRFPEHAEAVVRRVQRMLGATEEEMAAGMKVRPRNDWKPAPPQKTGTGGPLADARERIEWGPDANTGLKRLLNRDLPERYVPAQGHVAPKPPQAPNAERAGKAAVKATEKIITRVQSAIKNAPKK